MLIGNNKESENDAIYLSNIVNSLIYVNYSDDDVTFDKDNIKVINKKISNFVKAIHSDTSYILQYYISD